MAPPPPGNALGEAPTGPSQNLKEYDPEWGHAFSSGRATATCDHENMRARVEVPVLFTHHFHDIDPRTGNLLGAISDLQVDRARQLVTSADNEFIYQCYPDLPHFLHGHDPVTYVNTVAAWLSELNRPARRADAVAPTPPPH